MMNKEKALNYYCNSRLRPLNSSVRSYLMYHHQTTKISRATNSY